METQRWRDRDRETVTGRGRKNGERKKERRRKKGWEGGRRGGTEREKERERERANVDPETGDVDGRAGLHPPPQFSQPPPSAPSTLHPAYPTRSAPLSALPPLGSKCPSFLACAPPLLQPHPPHPQQKGVYRSGSDDVSF